MSFEPLPDAIDEYLSTTRSELVEFAETLVGSDTQNPPSGTREVIDRPYGRPSRTIDSNTELRNS